MRSIHSLANGGPGSVMSGSPVSPPSPALGLTRPRDPAGRQLLLVPALNARLAQQLAMLLLRHPLAALLDYRAHETTLDRYPRATAPQQSPPHSRSPHTNATAYPAR